MMHPATLRDSAFALLSGLTSESLPLPGHEVHSKEQPDVSLVILAANVPCLAAQSLLPLLSHGSAVVFKPSRREPHTARLLVESLCQVEPDLADAVAIFEQPEGSSIDLDSSLPDRVVVYGQDATVSDVRKRFSGVQSANISEQGHSWSLVYLDSSCIDSSTLAAVARDIARFDQRGCLCPHVVITSASAQSLVLGLGEALCKVADELPATMSPSTLATLRQVRDTAVAAGLPVAKQPLDTGLVAAQSTEEAIEESPGGRCVRVFGGVSLDQLIERLKPLSAEIQSLALAVSTSSTGSARATVQAIGIDRVIEPGLMHAPDFTWVAQQLGLRG